MAVTGGSSMAKGSIRMIPISGPSPGSAPTTRPKRTPSTVSPMAIGVRESAKPAERESINMFGYQGMIRPRTPPGSTTFSCASKKYETTRERPTGNTARESGLRSPPANITSATISTVAM